MRASSLGLARSARFCARRARPSPASRAVLPSQTLTKPSSSLATLSKLKLNEFVGARRFTSLSFPPHTLPSSARRPLSCSASSPTSCSHSAYFLDRACIPAPPLLPALVRVLQAQGHSLLNPKERKGLHPLLMPLAQGDQGDGVLGLLRWPEATSGVGLPVVRSGEHGLTLVAHSAQEYIHRALVQEDMELGSAGPVRAAAGPEASDLYSLGEIEGQARLEVFLVTKVGKIPSAMQQLVAAHQAKGDTESALITAEWMQGHMSEWGFGAAFLALMLRDLGRMDEARDQARVALCSPWWTLGHSFVDMSALAGYEGQDPKVIRQSLQGEVAVKLAQAQGSVPGVTPPTAEETAFEEAKALMDLAHISGDWEAARPQIIAKFQEAGFNKVAFFIGVA
mmetsp:Transcript_11039/g.15020  ORF Transcript_11039/g.15020 Transcript_11039/m.15020 type:complete len:395 (+) Transcript_11039:103-1287(+)|eukprot:CAMPEP_0196582086 /NCGR_PEP_ID=MMETSP1081-20130531/37437_1 /TAXON_ID=36882 /ORGANISM="Pyramimonas amylifera, Strain CCMP720" /LENGTH=394 /DNA_ID=CAMNT_0041902563 /DNA_START=88 /DNA_END=1272 /DNA_ORIENTATION=-